jgi:hypothetical protein
MPGQESRGQRLCGLCNFELSDFTSYRLRVKVVTVALLVRCVLLALQLLQGVCGITLR